MNKLFHIIFAMATAAMKTNRLDSSEAGVVAFI